MKPNRQSLLDLQNDDRQPVILRLIVNLVVPFIMVFGLYIVFNGHLSPGGGFSGGAILGAGLALYASAFGAERVRRFFTFKTFGILTSIALGFYAIVKGLVFFTKGLPIPLGAPGSIFSAGLILPLNICVGIIVACTIYGLYSLFAEGEV